MKAAPRAEDVPGQCRGEGGDSKAVGRDILQIITLSSGGGHWSTFYSFYLSLGSSRQLRIKKITF